MARRARTLRWQRPFLHGALLAVVAGLGALYSPAGPILEHWSYDLPTLATRALHFPELVLVEMDEPSHRELGQDHGAPWDHRLHAQLVDFLRENGARLIVFDVEFTEKSRDPSATAALAEAFRRHGRVVLGSALTYTGKKGFGSATVVRPPLRELLVPGVIWAVSWDLPGPKGEEDGIVRIHPRGRDPDVSLPWAAAVEANAALSQSGIAHDAERWVRHYGPGDSLPRVSYWQATNEAPGFYRGRTVFIGGRPSTAFNGETVDQFRTPWSRWNHPAVSGLELTATAWLNLIRGDWLVRFPFGWELVVLMGFGAAIGGGMAVSSLRQAFGIGLGACLFTALGALWLFQGPHRWGAWLVIAGVQIPIALGWRLIQSHLDLRLEKRWLEAPLAPLQDPTSAGDLFAPAGTTANDSSIRGQSSRADPTVPTLPPSIPDYDLLRCVGRGAYGEAWLARDIVGGFRVVKIVRRSAFDDDRPYEREFRGLQGFSPISREHPGLVQVLHAGLNRAAGFFFYVMEAGDDECTGRKIDPERYVPRDLARDLRQHGRRSPRGAADLGLALADALAYLHERGLIHRDIKPANVIFVGGRPKLADVGLVTAAGTRPLAVTQIGTAGYMPPEGIGAPAGDVFALGRVLAETVESPGLPDNEAHAAFLRLVARAHAPAAEDRFASARSLHSALAAWKNEHLPAADESASIRT